MEEVDRRRQEKKREKRELKGKEETEREKGKVEKKMRVSEGQPGTRGINVENKGDSPATDNSDGWLLQEQRRVHLAHSTHTFKLTHADTPYPPTRTFCAGWTRDKTDKGNLRIVIITQRQGY